jgi:hypothetical protein
MVADAEVLLFSAIVLPHYYVTTVFSSHEIARERACISTVIYLVEVIVS